MANLEHGFSGENQSVETLAQIHKVNVEAVLNYKQQILNEEVINEEFIGMPLKEVNRHFSEAIKELEYSYCLSLLSATEARFRMDYVVRATQRLRDDLSRRFRDIYKEEKRNVRFEVILDNWKEYHPDLKTHVGYYNGALQLRHWLAHGRYWTPKFGNKYNPESVYLICESISNELPFEI
ncbi:hypothetical protein AWH48_16465 [Domibacillus aminovorans]|uniref:DUF4209 domain-containing protein n=1 Tax=Domibacillus aminovorans TaxID=29332 RepID=A0A177KYV9_9BACI|nr:hypothetical protein [Domibacillus aminovorans]OAH58599.1 hypothetical protein AWH48_16465 [Domibacillus aminovorans]